MQRPRPRRNRRHLAAPALAVCLAVVAVIPLAVPPALAQPQADPFADLVGLSGDVLRSALHDRIAHHKKLRYSDIWAVLTEAHPHPLTPTLVLDIYRNHGFVPTAHTEWNREHAWPKRFGFIDSGEGRPCNVPYTDAHILFPADARYNSSRSDVPYDDCPGCTPWPVEDYPDTPNRRSHAPAPPAWEVWPGRRGDAARALFYADVRYEGDAEGSVGRDGTACPEPDLELTDDRDAIAATPTTTLGVAFMGVLSTVIRWNLEDVVDERERFRQEVIARPALQANRNPFVDHPEFICRIWHVGICATWQARVWLPWGQAH